MQRWWTIAATGLMLAPALTGCLKPATIETEDPWVRLPAVAGRPASGYFTLHGGATPTRLVAVSADRAVRTEMHRSMMTGGPGGGTMTMQPVRDLPLPAHGTLRFAPGGLHLMIFGLDPAMKKGDATILTFTFADGSRMERKAWAVGAGDPAPD
jgi:copper(I)-binding protein